MSSISRRRRHLNIKENNLKSFLTPKPCREVYSEGEVPTNSNSGKGKGLSFRVNGKENLECVLDSGNKKELFNDKENVSPNIGKGSTETHNLKPRDDSKNIRESFKNSSTVTTLASDGQNGTSVPLKNIPKVDGTSISSQLSADEIITFLTQDEPGEKYYQTLAEQRRKALKETLAENERLTTVVDELRETTTTLQGQLDSALELVRLYEKIIESNKTEDTPAN